MAILWNKYEIREANLDSMAESIERLEVHSNFITILFVVTFI